MLVKRCIAICLRLPHHSLSSRLHSATPTDATLMKCQQRKHALCRHRGGGSDESTSSTTCLSQHPQRPQRNRPPLKRPAPKPECCSFRVQLQHAVLQGVFPVFLRGTSGVSPFELLLHHAPGSSRTAPHPTSSWLTYHHHHHLSPPRL